MEHLFKYLPLLFVAFGLVIILISIKRIADGRGFVRRAQRVPGVVSDVRTTFTGQGDHLRAMQRPVLTFTTVDGREITTEAATTSRLGIGNEAEVLYDPENPTVAVPAEDAGGSYSGIVIGLIAVVIGLAFFAVFAGFVGFHGFDKGETWCETQQADGSVDQVECPPGFFR
ncbi:DUF3592 domain-containing protein [Nonomuraea sp. NPDC050536]|uniref:DUF3592 domain-containing protein n=1 Tax=Nonomuraea sp. NPDC050536 TaxID=3364366 RepID=UPI0037C50BD9